MYDFLWHTHRNNIKFKETFMVLILDFGFWKYNCTSKRFRDTDPQWKKTQHRSEGKNGWLGAGKEFCKMFSLLHIYKL